MNIDTNLHGRLRNTPLPLGGALLPLYEAVVNSIHGIEDAGLGPDRGKIAVRIRRDDQAALRFACDDRRPGPEARADITGFEIVDNGIGFTDVNLESFRVLDSEYKVPRGGRGVGRLLWLKAFDGARVSSVYVDTDGLQKLRSFDFDARQGVFNLSSSPAPGSDLRTTITLHGFVERYREASPKSGKIIAKNLFEHCLWYFVRPGGAPSIVVIDDDEIVDLHTVYDDHMISNAATETLSLKGTPFDLVHVKLSAASTRTHGIAFCAASRLVTKENIRGKIPGLYGSLRDEAGDFVYECYVSSPLLDERVRPERTSFEIAEEPLDLFAATDLSQHEIRDAVLGCASRFLAQHLEEKRQLGRERVADFVEHRAPRYRPILRRIDEEVLSVDPGITDKELDLLLHKQLAEVESKMLAEGHDILRPQALDNFPDYRARLDEYLRTAEDIRQSDLANYVSHRRVIIDLLELAIQRDPQGHYVREDLIHALIMPMQKDSNEVPPEGSNLWLIDERLAFHNYLASDKSIRSMPITASTDKKEPDLVALNLFDTPMLVADGPQQPLASLTVVELKRPMRNDAAEGEDKDPIEQALGYLERIRLGRVTTSTGRPIANASNIPGFCYVLCDITPTIESRCRMHDAIQTSDGLGYFFYKKSYNAYVEVISFDRLVGSAKQRNRAFFDKLGLPTR